MPGSHTSMRVLAASARSVSACGLTIPEGLRRRRQQPRSRCCQQHRGEAATSSMWLLLLHCCRPPAHARPSPPVSSATPHTHVVQQAVHVDVQVVHLDLPQRHISLLVGVIEVGVEARDSHDVWLAHPSLSHTGRSLTCKPTSVCSVGVGCQQCTTAGWLATGSRKSWLKQ